MKTLVTYFSQTGKTKQVAEAIFETITGEKEIKEISEVESILEHDLSFVGFPIHAFAPPGPVKLFLQNKCEGRKLVLFMTHAQPEDYGELGEWINTCKAEAASAEIVDVFTCQGEILDSILEAMQSSDDPYVQKLSKGAATSKGQPDAARIERARAFAADILSRYA